MTKPVFLSYRRNDAPGYVARLGDDLHKAYGDVVFRDVDGILAGDDWKTAIRRQVAQAKVVLVLIGPDWSWELEKRRDNTDVDYVLLELTSARELKIPVLPVLVGEAALPGPEILGDLAWLRDAQSYSLLDTQQRWAHDSGRLVERVGDVAELQRIVTNTNHSDSSPKEPWWKDPKWLIGAVTIPIIIGVWTMWGSNGGATTVITGDCGVIGENTVTGETTVNCNKNTDK